MNQETDSILEAAGRDAYKRLQSCWGGISPTYGKEFAGQVMSFLNQKMMLPTEDRKKWLVEELKLNVAIKKQLSEIGAPWVLSVNLLTTAATYGAEDFIPILKATVAHLTENNIDVPQNLQADIKLTCDWMNTKYGTNL